MKTADAARRPSDLAALAILAFTVLVTTLPFINRAYFVDDYYFVKMAQGILEHPSRPYDFRSDDAGFDNLGWERGHFPRMVNPPLFHYYLAGVMKLSQVCLPGEGWGAAGMTTLLRGSMIPFSILALFSMYFLGKRFTARPLSAALLMAFTPVYWLTSFSLLIDSMLIGVLLAGVWCFIAAHERRSRLMAWGAGFILGLAMLVKYFGVLGIVLAFVWQMMDPQRRRWWGGYGAYAAFLVLQLVWAGWNISTYGEPHLLATLPRGMSTIGLFYADKVVISLIFFGGGTVFALGAYALLWIRARTALLGLSTLLVVLFAVLYSPFGGYSISQSAQIIFWLGAGAAFFMRVYLEWKGALSATERFVLLWLAIGFVELVVVMPWTAGRYFLCLLPAACWLMIKILPDSLWPRWGTAVLSMTACAGLFVASADYAQANVIRNLATALPAREGNSFYLGDTFSGYEPYLKPLGWQAAFPNQAFKKGDWLLVPKYRQSSWWRLPDTLRLELVNTFEFQSPLLVRVMDIPSSAGWYASVWGTLPFVLTRDPLERFDIYRVL